MNSRLVDECTVRLHIKQRVKLICSQVMMQNQRRLLDMRQLLKVVEVNLLDMVQKRVVEMKLLGVLQKRMGLRTSHPQE